MSGHLKISDPAFDRAITLRDAYRIMEEFVHAHYERGEVSTLDLFAYFCVAPDGTSSDPAAFVDFLAAAAAVLDGAAPAEGRGAPGGGSPRAV